MEYVHGEDVSKLLAKVRERGEMVPLEHVVAIITATAAGLHHAHEQRGPVGEPLGLVHLDVCPQNILLGYDGSVKLVDFGMAKAARRSTKTAAGALKGKASYMSPEQCCAHAIDRRTDTFALGIVLYELATAQRLFKGANEFLTMAAIVEGTIPPPSTVRAGLPKALDDIVLRALARAPEARYQTVEDLREALERFAIEHELRASNKAFADYMSALFGQRPEPWHSDEEPQAPTKDFDSTAVQGVVATPQNEKDVLERHAPSSTAPIMLARSVAEVEAETAAAEAARSEVDDGWGDEEPPTTTLQPEDLPVLAASLATPAAGAAAVAASAAGASTVAAPAVAAPAVAAEQVAAEQVVEEQVVAEQIVAEQIVAESVVAPSVTAEAVGATAMVAPPDVATAAQKDGATAAQKEVATAAQREVAIASPSDVTIASPTDVTLVAPATSSLVPAPPVLPTESTRPVTSPGGTALPAPASPASKLDTDSEETRNERPPPSASGSADEDAATLIAPPLFVEDDPLDTEEPAQAANDDEPVTIDGDAPAPYAARAPGAPSFAPSATPSFAPSATTAPTAPSAQNPYDDDEPPPLDPPSYIGPPIVLAEPPQRAASEHMYIGPPAPPAGRIARAQRFFATHRRSILVIAGASVLALTLSLLVMRSCGNANAATNDATPHGSTR
jgi:hypothetical protein